MMREIYVVTGAAGFIGSNIIRGLNARGINNIFAVDDFAYPGQFANLTAGTILRYWDKDEFLQAVLNHQLSAYQVRAVFHEGACSDTMNHDGRYMMRNNYQYSVDLCDWCQDQKIPFIYASSAAVYGKNTVFREERQFEEPLNVYGFSKFLFDEYCRALLREQKLKAPIVGLRYFNVYGPNEGHKGKMASVVRHHYQQMCRRGYVELFGAYDGYDAGEQVRDFIAVEDIVKVNLFFLTQPQTSGIFNLGTGQSRSFNDLAAAAVNGVRATSGGAALDLPELIKEGFIRYITFPDALKGKYQSYTEADITALRAVGYNGDFCSLETGVARYVQELINLDGK